MHHAGYGGGCRLPAAGRQREKAELKMFAYLFLVISIILLMNGNLARASADLRTFLCMTEENLLDLLIQSEMHQCRSCSGFIPGTSSSLPANCQPP